MENKKVRLGLIGAGGFANLHLEELKKVEE